LFFIYASLACNLERESPALLDDGLIFLDETGVMLLLATGKSSSVSGSLSITLSRTEFVRAEGVITEPAAILLSIGPSYISFNSS
jgi:hypothetical protein